MKAYFHIFFLGMLLAFPFGMVAQIRDSSVVQSVPLTLPKDSLEKKKWLLPGVKFFGTHLIPFSVNRWIRKMDYARISWESVGENIKPSSWEWDLDNFVNNQFSHPYHGSLYYNSLRSEGFSFWQSAPAAFAGSLVWEIAGEVDRPAPNDLINTTFGGIAFGEMTHLLGRRFTQNFRSGKKKNALDIVGMLVDPMEGISLLTSKKRRMAKQDLDTTRMEFEYSAGVRQYNREVNKIKLLTRGELFTRLFLLYGADYANIKTPFSHFSVLIELGRADTSIFNIAQIRGALRGWEYHKTAAARHFGLMSIDYDYYQNSAFSFGMQSFQYNFISRFTPLPKFAFQTELGIGAISLAAVSDDELYTGVGRNYGYGSGGGLTVKAYVHFKNNLSFRTNMSMGWMATLNGNNAYYRILVSSSALRYQWKRLFFEYESGNFILKSVYKDDKYVLKHNYYKRLSTGYRFYL